MQQPPIENVTENEVLRTTRLEAREILLRHPAGKGSITLMAAPEGVGIWLAQEESEKFLVAIIAFPGQAAGLGVYGPGSRECPNVALTVSEQGAPFVQLFHHQQLLHLGTEQFQKLLDPAQQTVHSQEAVFEPLGPDEIEQES